MSKVFTLIYIVLFANYVTAKVSPMNRNKTLYSVVCASDYREVVKKKYFIDKSLLILDFFYGPKVMLLTGPSLFGKSTIVDMLKRFFEITTTDLGKPVYVPKTENFYLFNNNFLRISKWTRFVKEHFGKHPVVHINFEPLNEMRNLSEMVKKMRIVLHRTFIQHNYLEENDVLWRDNVDGKEKMMFINYVNRFHHLTLKKWQIVNGFRYLSRLLFEHFNKKVIILVDGYDTFMQTLMFRNDDHMTDIIAFMSQINQDLMKVDSYTERVFITGVLRIVDRSLIPPVHKVDYHYFLRSRLFSRYVGINDDELGSLLDRATNDPIERQQAMTEIQFHYNGYQIESKNERILNTWSVLNYLENNKTIERYWCDKKHYKSLAGVFRIPRIAEEIGRLLLGDVAIRMNISEPLTKEIIATVKKLAKDSVVEMRYHIDCFLAILYDFGYLTGTVNNVNGIPIAKLRIPNREILLEFSTFVQESYIDRFRYSTQNILELNEAIDFFQPNSIRSETFQHFHGTLKGLFLNSTHYPQSKSDIQKVLFVNLVQRFPKSVLEILIPLNPSVRVPETIDLLIMNRYAVGVVFEITLLEGLHPLENDLENAARMCYNRLHTKYHWYTFHTFGQLREAVYVGMSFDKYTRSICTACSFVAKINPFLNPVVTK